MSQLAQPTHIERPVAASDGGTEREGDEADAQGLSVVPDVVPPPSASLPSQEADTDTSDLPTPAHTPPEAPPPTDSVCAVESADSSLPPRPKRERERERGRGDWVEQVLYTRPNVLCTVAHEDGTVQQRGVGPGLVPGTLSLVSRRRVGRDGRRGVGGEPRLVWQGSLVVTPPPSLSPSAAARVEGERETHSPWQTPPGAVSVREKDGEGETRTAVTPDVSQRERQAEPGGSPIHPPSDPPHPMQIDLPLSAFNSAHITHSKSTPPRLVLTRHLGLLVGPLYLAGGSADEFVQVLSHLCDVTVRHTQPQASEAETDTEEGEGVAERARVVADTSSTEILFNRGPLTSLSKGGGGEGDTLVTPEVQHLRQVLAHQPSVQGVEYASSIPGMEGETGAESIPGDLTDPVPCPVRIPLSLTPLTGLHPPCPLSLNEIRAKVLDRRTGLVNTDTLRELAVSPGLQSGPSSVMGLRVLLGHAERESEAKRVWEKGVRRGRESGSRLSRWRRKRERKGDREREREREKGRHRTERARAMCRERQSTLRPSLCGSMRERGSGMDSVSGSASMGSESEASETEAEEGVPLSGVDTSEGVGVGAYQGDPLFPLGLSESDRALYLTCRQQWTSVTPSQAARWRQFRRGVQQIAKDVARTDRQHEFYRGHSELYPVSPLDQSPQLVDSYALGVLERYLLSDRHPHTQRGKRGRERNRNRETHQPQQLLGAVSASQGEGSHISDPEVTDSMYTQPGSEAGSEGEGTEGVSPSDPGPSLSAYEGSEATDDSEAEAEGEAEGGVGLSGREALLDRHPNSVRLFCLLVSHLMANMDMGYCQGMSDVASAVLYSCLTAAASGPVPGIPSGSTLSAGALIRAETEAFTVFRLMMSRFGGGYSPSRSSVSLGLTHQLSSLSAMVQRVSPRLHDILTMSVPPPTKSHGDREGEGEGEDGTQQRGRDSLVFACKWLLLLFKRDLASIEDCVPLWCQAVAVGVEDVFVYLALAAVTTRLVPALEASLEGVRVQMVAEGHTTQSEEGGEEGEGDREGGPVTWAQLIQMFTQGGSSSPSEAPVSKGVLECAAELSRSMDYHELMVNARALIRHLK
ncbi:hypothetical protein KIPB_007023 [Kipferlia bialata]|uniref:Rab-GAP TBC domain-containing protein n=1 Tax=Kipferlia bialata TaxID=797122 RepID=A0A9K3D072_9EUKA|nr:hypothetical protein KIPB_007023 [Kipferlia bialata]|eukprot:g7023.t1